MHNSPLDLIDSVEKLQEALSHWKNTTFSQHYLKLEDVIASFDTPELCLVNARQEFAPRWLLCRPGAKKPATFWTAGVWRWSSHLETGNYVPPGEVAPARLAESRIQRVPNNLCQFSYGVDTTHDNSLWEAQAKFEEYIVNVNGFNPHQKDRREWQNSAGSQPSFVFSSQMFVKRTSYTRAKEASHCYDLHPWIAAATKKGMEFFPNNERPKMFEPDAAGGLRPLSDCNPPTLKIGDLVWVSFSVEFFIGGKFWSTNFVSYEFVRVGTVALELLPEIRKEFDLDDIEAPRERLGAGMRGVTINDTNPSNEGRTQLLGPSSEHQGSTVAFQSPSLAPAPESAASESTVCAEDPELLRRVTRESDLLRPRSPELILDSEADVLAESVTNDETDEDDYNDTMELGDDDSTTRDSMLVDDEALEDAAPATSADADKNEDNDEDDKDDDDDSFVVPDDASVVADEATVEDAQVSTDVHRCSAAHSNHGPIQQPEADKKSVAHARPVPNSRGKKRAASSERPPVEGGVVVGTRVLRDRRAKGKAVAR